MVLDEMNAIYNPWSLLQQPVHPGPGANSSFRALLAALDQGWQVIEPVQVLPSAQQESWIYYWVLTHPKNSQTSVLFVPAIQEVERFIEQNHYQVIECSYFW